MEAQSKFIPHAKLAEWLKELSSKFEVFAPQKSGKAVTGAEAAGAVVYRKVNAEGELSLELNKKPTESAKQVIFPRSEALLSFSKNQDAENPGKTSLQITEAPAPAQRLVFGLLSCDARGFLIFDPVYNGSGTSGQAKDVYYLKRRASTVLIVKACSKVLSTCFCNWVGGSPASSEGADVLATELKDGYILTPVTERGAAVLGSSLLSDATDTMQQEASASHSAAEAALKPAEDISSAPKAVLEKFDDMEFWGVQSAHCLSCGACTYLCPTCYCFNITDENAGMSGVRLRNWDACMTPLFTMEASGHNPRTAKAARLKNRVGHKFSYYPDLHEARFACVGCGRCIKSCPSAVDIRRIVTDAAGITQARKMKEQNNG